MEEDEKGEKRKQRNTNNNIVRWPAISNLCPNVHAGTASDSKVRVKGEASQISISEQVCLPLAWVVPKVP